MKLGDKMITHNERYAVIFRVPREEAEISTYGHREQEQLARYWGYKMVHHDNRTKECKDEMKASQDRGNENRDIKSL